MQQFYDDKQIIEIVGQNAWIEDKSINKLRDIDFDLRIVESTNTPGFRQMANDILMQLWQAQAISVEQLLEHGDFPFADDLLQSIRSQKEQLEQGQIPDAMSPQLQQQVQSGTNMQNVQAAHQMLMNPQQQMSA